MADVVIGSRSIRRQVEQGGGALGLIFVPDGPRTPSLADTDAAIGKVRPPYFTEHVYRAVPVTEGHAVFFDPVWDSSEALRLATEFAEAMAEAGFAGRVAPCAARQARGWGAAVPVLYAALCAVEAAYDEVWVPPAERVLDVQRWAVGTEPFGALVGGVMDWALARCRSSLRAGPGLSFAECRPEQATDVVVRCLADVGDCTVVFDADLSEVQIKFTPDGYVLVGYVLDQGVLAPALEDLQGLIEALAPNLDYAFITRAGSFHTTPHSLIGGEPRYAPSLIGRRMAEERAALRESVIDIFPVQLLGPEHGDLLPGESWSRSALPKQRRLVALHNPETWLSGESPPMNKLHQLRSSNRGHLLADVKLYRTPADMKPWGPAVNGDGTIRD